MKRLLLLLLYTTVISCEESVKYTLPEVKPVLAAEIIAEAGAPVRAFISTSVPIMSNNEPGLNSSTLISLYENGILVDTLHFVDLTLFDFPFNAYNYISDYMATTGASYTLIMENDSFPIATANDKIPLVPKLEKFKVDTIAKKIHISIADHPEEGTFYRIEIRDRSFGYLINHNCLDASFETIYQNLNILPDDIPSGLISLVPDKSFNGNVKEFIINYIPGDSITDSLAFIFSSISPAYYEYEISKSSQNNSGSLGFNENSNVMGNIENAYGAFLCRNSIIKIFKP